MRIVRHKKFIYLLSQAKSKTEDNISETNTILSLAARYSSSLENSGTMSSKPVTHCVFWAAIIGKLKIICPSMVGF